MIQRAFPRKITLIVISMRKTDLTRTAKKKVLRIINFKFQIVKHKVKLTSQNLFVKDKALGN